MKLLARILLLLALTHPLYAENVSYTDLVTGGSLKVANTHETAAYELKSVMFSISDVALTNVFTISPVRPYRVPDTLTTVVETNTLSGADVLTTNTVRYAGGTTWITNSIIVATTENITTTQFYDWTDFGYGLMFEPYDEMTFTFTSTNDIYLIRNYDVKSRP